MGTGIVHLPPQKSLKLHAGHTSGRLSIPNPHDIVCPRPACTIFSFGVGSAMSKTKIASTLSLRALFIIVEVLKETLRYCM
jgi:hypothetical protein